MNNSINYYDRMSSPRQNEYLSGFERAILVEEVKLPDLQEDKDQPLTADYLAHHDEYKLAFNQYKDIRANFNIPILSPLMDNREKTTLKNNNSPSVRSHTGVKLNTNSYQSSNYVTLVIPKYLLYNFKEKIPKGTEFIIVNVGGSSNVSDMRIIGIYSTFEEKEEDK